ncbi:MAG: PilZ domain-containing protein [Treponema sp.]|nr:PilZ domain-containing protein [Treponema sp.]
MAIVNSNQIAKYYDFFRDKEIVFTKANLKALHIDPRQVYLKCNGGQWPCIINSSTLQMAKIIIGTGSGAYQEMQKNKDATVQLKYCFIDQGNETIHFYVTCSVQSLEPYQNTKELSVVTLDFTQRPPDELIYRIGEFLEASENFYNRKEDRIDINKNTLRKLGIEKEESVVWIDNVPRRCILKDLSFSGAKVMLVGVPKFLVGKPINLKIDFIDTNESIIVQGIIPRAEFLEGRKDISSVHIAFNNDIVPMTYKLHINSFITTFQKSVLGNQQNAESQTAVSE